MMSEIMEQKVSLYQKVNKDLVLGLSDDFIAKITKDLGSFVVCNHDREMVSCGQESEKDTIINNFILKKLQCGETKEEMHSVIDSVCEKMGHSNKSKYRVLFYGLIAVHYGREDYLD
jgi:hypothetical protein